MLPATRLVGSYLYQKRSKPNPRNAGVDLDLLQISCLLIGETSKHLVLRLAKADRMGDLPECYIRGEEPFVIGLSPSFWAHVPFLITQLIHSVRLENSALWYYEGDNISSKKYPVSKCKLVGWIVAADHRGSKHQYVVDDGTGLMDCLHWTEEEELLPSLLPSSYDRHLFHCGDLVRVMGRMVVAENTTTGTATTTVVSELRVTSLHHATPAEELHHWRICTKDDGDSSLSHPLSILQSLSRDLQQQIANRTDLPSADDTIGAWRLFGPHCPCTGRVKEELLYCSCIARPQALDPQLVYRMGLLEYLIRKLDRNGNNNELRVRYDRIRDDREELYALAQQVVAAAPGASSANSRKHQQLVEHTFRCLRQDGILYLEDDRLDTYLLLSKRPVLENCIADSLDRPYAAKPAYLEHVPSARLQVVRRGLLQQRKSAAATLPMD